MRLAYLAVLATLVAAPVLAEDLTIVSKQTRGDNPPVTTTSYFSSEKMRTVNGESSEAMIDFATGNITFIDNAKKEYSVMTREEMDAMVAQMEAQMKQLDSQMANLPPGMREKVQAMSGGGMGANVTVQKGSGGRTIAGYSCQNWVINMGESVRQESCVTSDLAMPMAVYDGQKKAFASLAGTPMGKAMMAMADKLKEMKGVTLATTTNVKMMGKGMTTTSEVTEIKKGALPATAFDIPGGYKKVDSPAAKGLAGMKNRK
jgi:hypothetical protein